MQNKAIVFGGVGLVAVAVVVATILWVGAEGGNGAPDISEDGAVISEAAPLDGALPNSATEVSTSGQAEDVAVGSVMVEVQGAVAAPGFYAFPPNARLWDALAKAGGVTNDADTEDLNIAARLIDGSVLTVPFRATGSQTAGALNSPAYTRSGWGEVNGDIPGRAAGVPSQPSSVRININSASQSELESLPGVGPKTAEKIMQFRRQQPFRSVEDLRLVSGIGDKRVETLRPLVTVE